MQGSHADRKKGQTGHESSKRVVRIRHEPLLLFLFLWHCLDVHIYWDFCLGRAMTEPHGKRRDRETEREHEDRGQKEEKMEDERLGRENMVNIYTSRDKYKCDFMQ